MKIETFAEIEAEFLARIATMVWCNIATIDTQNRPRSRVVHPIWAGSTGWLTTRRTSFKAKHLAHNPFVSLAYIADVSKPVYVDCLAAWDDSLASKQHVWELFRTTPPPLGYDPGTIFPNIEHPNFGILKFTPWRIELAHFPGEPHVWHNPAVAAPVAQS